MNINSFIDNRKANVKNLFQEALGIKSIPGSWLDRKYQFHMLLFLFIYRRVVTLIKN